MYTINLYKAATSCQHSKHFFLLENLCCKHDIFIVENKGIVCDT